MLTITLKPGKEKSLLRRHPWIFPDRDRTRRRQAGRKEQGRATALVQSSSGPIPGARRVQPEVADPRTSLELQRERSDRSCADQAPCEKALAYRAAPCAIPMRYASSSAKRTAFLDWSSIGTAARTGHLVLPVPVGRRGSVEGARSCRRWSPKPVAQTCQSGRVSPANRAPRFDRRFSNSCQSRRGAGAPGNGRPRRWPGSRRNSPDCHQQDLPSRRRPGRRRGRTSGFR